MRLLLRCIAAAICILMLLIPTSDVFGQQKKSGTAEGSGSYGNTPDELRPYRGFNDPYKLFFAEEQPFLGTGREKKPPANLKSVRIGFLGPLDDASPEAILGKRMLQGATLALEEANAAGGYRGLPFEMVIRDDVGPWGAASNKLVELNDEKVWVVLGSIDGQSTHIALRVALKLELPMVTSGSTDPTLTETRIPWYIRVNGDDRQFCYTLARYIYSEKKIERVAVLRANSRYGRVGIGEFRDAARRLGKPLLLELRYGSGDTDFATQLERIKNSSAQAVVLWGDAEEMAAIVKQMRALGMKHPVFGSDRLVSPEFLKAAGAASEGIVAAYPYDPARQDEKLKRFNEAYRARFGEEPEAQAAHAYDGMKLIIEAIGAAGLNRAGIRDWLTGIKRHDGVTGEIILDPTWNDVGAVYLATVRDGKYQFMPSPLSR